MKGPIRQHKSMAITGKPKAPVAYAKGGAVKPAPVKGGGKNACSGKMGKKC